MSMMKINKIIYNIYKDLSIRGSTPEELFSDFDRYRSGSISIETFNRALISYNIRLRNQEFQELTNALGEKGRINCQKFLKKLKEVVNEVEEKGDSDISQYSSQSNCDILLKNLAHYLSIHHLTLREVLRQFDKVNRGSVTVSDFVRAFESVPSIRAKEIANIFKDRYSDFVPYLQIDKTMKMFETDGLNDDNSFSQESVTSIPKPAIAEQIIVRMVSGNMTNIRQLFEQFDPANTGFVLQRTFPRILEKARIFNITPNDYHQIYEFYGSQGQVRYLPIVEEVENRINEKESTNSKIYQGKYGEVVDTDQLIKKMQESFIDRRINISDFFEYAVNGKVDKYKFMKTLSVEYRQLSVDEINALADRFDIGNSTVDINAFLSFFQLRPKQRNAILSESTLIDETIDVDSVLLAIKDHLSSRRLCLQRECELFDRFRKGTITNAQLLVSMQRCGLSFKNGEFDAICDEFRTKEIGVVDYVSLCSIVDVPDLYNRQIEQLQQEQSQKNASLRQRLYDNDDLIDDQNISSDNRNSFATEINKKDSSLRKREIPSPPENIMKIVAKIADITRNKDIFLHDEFEYRDRTRRGLVNNSDFYRVFDIACVPSRVKNNEIVTVYRYYSDNSDMFDYESFCRDIMKCNQEARKTQRENGINSAQMTNSYQNDESEEINESPEFIKALRKYRANLASRMLEADDVFGKYDTLNAGYIKEENLSLAFRAANFEMTPKEIQILLDAFHDKYFDNRFLYRKLDQRAKKEKCNATEIRMLMNPEFAEAEERRELHCALIETREKLHVRRRNAYMLFSKLTTPTISPEQFNQMLLDAGIILIHTQLNALTQKYTNGDMKNFDWQAFCDDCEKCALLGNDNYS